jgi:hypothetical protein
MTVHKTVPKEDWLSARKELLIKEKDPYVHFMAETRS